MKTRIITCLLIPLFFIVGTEVVLCQSQEEQYQKALMKEEGEGNLSEAINIFEKVAENTAAGEALQAKALLHLGLCYEKLGKQEATKAYQKLVNNYPAQKNEVAIARERLSKLIIENEKFTKKEGTNESEGITIKQVWTGSEVDHCGKISLDGKYLSFVNWDTGDIAVRDLKTKTFRNITTDGTWDDPCQFADLNLISPDGQKVVYQWYIDQNSELRLVDFNSLKPLTLLESKNGELYPLAWSGDGEKLVIQCFRKKDDYNSQLVCLNTLNNETVPLKGFTAMFISNVSFSPDMKFLAFDSPQEENNGNFDINLISIDGDNEKILVKHPSNDRLLGWVPGKKEFLFLSDRSGTNDIWMLENYPDNLYAEPKRIYTDVGNISPMGFTEKGILYFSSMHRKFTSFICPLSEPLGKISSKKVPLLGSVLDALWLDNDILICNQYVIKSDGRGIYKLCLVNNKTGESRLLGENINVNGPPRLSPDKKSVLFFGREIKRVNENNYYGGIFLVDVESGLPREIKVKEEIKGSYSVEWAGNNTTIFYTSSNKIINHNIETGEENIVYLGETNLIRPTLRRSPDNKRLFFDVRKEEGMNQLISISVNGSDISKLCEYDGYIPLRYKKIELSPDNKYIYFTERFNEDGSLLWRIPVNGGIAKKILSSKDPIAGIGIHPNGDKIAISVFEQEVEIRKIENLKQELSKNYSQNE